MNEKTTNTPMAAPIDLLEIWSIFWSRRLLILICVVLAVSGVYVKKTYFTPDTYSASGMIYVRNRSEEARAADPDDMVYGSDINTSNLMTNTYMQILTTRSFLTNVSNAIGGKYSWGQIRSMMSIGSVEESALLRISTVSGSPQDAAEIANAIISLAPDVMGEVFEGGDIKIIERAIEPSYPNGKGTARALMLGFMFGLAIGCAIAFLLDYLDNKIHRSDDVTKRYGISILGEISQ